MLIALLLIIVMWAVPVHAAEFAVAQNTLPTSNGGTADFTSSGFGTPKCAYFYGGYGTVNGTVVSDAGLWLGFYDGTNEFGNGFAAEDGQTTTDTGSQGNASGAGITLLSTDQTTDGTCTASWITDGVRLTCADAPPSAYLLNVLLIGGPGVSNCAVGQLTSNATLNGTASTTAPGFTPDVVIGFSRFGDAAHSRIGLGFAWRNGGTIVQRAAALYNQGAVTTSYVASNLVTNRLIINDLIGATATMELTSFDANGFTLTTRDAGLAKTMTYLALKLNGLSAWLGTSDSPTATGNQGVTGIGFLPQAGLMLHGEWAAVDTGYSTGNGEVLGVSAFTATQSAGSAVSSDDGVGTSNEDSVTDTKACRLRKDGADYATCTVSSMDSDGITFNYTVAPAAVTKRALLLFQSSGGGGGGGNGMMQRRRSFQ